MTGQPASISLGIGLTNACNLQCAHCYRPQGPPDFLGVRDVLACLDRFDVHSVNLGTGENILNPELPAVLDALAERGVRTSLTSNGTTLLELDEARLRRLHDVEVSMDFDERGPMDAFRGDGAFDRAVRAIERVRGLGLRVTVIAVLMNVNYDRLGRLARLARSWGAALRVNAYQPVHTRRFMPSWSQFWDGYRALFDEAAVTTCTEHVVAAALDVPLAGDGDGGGCARRSVRLTPTGELLPCVYWPRSAGRLADVPPGAGGALFESAEFVAARSAPAACRTCELWSRCRGGCPSRRALLGRPGDPDPYCPLAGPSPVRLHARVGAPDGLLHGANVCTTIVA